MVDPKMLVNPVAYLSYIFILYFMYRSAVDERRKNEGLLSFSEALKVSFLTFVIGKLFYSIYIYLMFNYFDPSLNEVLREVTADTLEYFAKLAGAEDSLDQVHDQMESQNMQMSFSILFLDYLVELIFPGFIIALVISAITKKENP